MSGKHRLDQLLTLRGLAPTRSRARDIIKRGLVTVAGRVETRAGLDLPDDADIAVAEEWSDYVSRGALKLEAALDRFGFDCKGRIALDIGASTGGFTQMLLRRGAARVYAVDVGRGQLHPTIATDARVLNLENIDARKLNGTLISQPVDAITADVSFISLTKALPAALTLAAPGAWAVALIKPQFEAGREHVGKGGIVKDDKIRAGVVEQIAEFFRARQDWRVAGTMLSPITGQSGNAEFLIGARYEP